MNQKDIHRVAKTLVREYGAGAAAHASRRMQEMISRRDVHGAGVWRSVLRALRELQGSRRRARH